MLDAAKGLVYLYGNGSLHRDIKPDNVLVFALDCVVEVNGKLTDFGSSRNVNMLMTNMTFTKGYEGVCQCLRSQVPDESLFQTAFQKTVLSGYDSPSPTRFPLAHPSLD